jgi:hypothetical protein
MSDIKRRLPSHAEALAILTVCTHNSGHCGQEQGCIFNGKYLNEAIGRDCIFNEVASKNKPDDLEIPTCSDWFNYIPCSIEIPAEILAAAERVIKAKDELYQIGKDWAANRYPTPPRKE